MPKNKGRRKKVPQATKQGQNAADGSQSEDDDGRSETSAVSVDSEMHHSDQGGDIVDETVSQEEVEDKVKIALDGLTEKSAQHRIDCLKTIIKAFSVRDMEEIFDNCLETLIDGAEKCLKRGKPEEQALASRLLALLSIQMGAGKSGEEMFHRFKSFLVPVILDESVNTKARSKCCEALAIGCFIAAEDMDDITGSMATLTNVFKKSYYKGDKTVPNITPVVGELHSTALLSWSLLMSICPWSIIVDFVKSHFVRLPEMLESKELSVRIAAGEALALFYEIIQSEEKDYYASKFIKEKDLCVKLQELATDSSRYRNKKDRRQQRSVFRDILHTVEDGDMLDDRIKFGNEVLYIDSWTKKRQYHSLRDILGDGIAFHLKTNELLRDIFNLGPPILATEGRSKRGSNERHLFNQAAFKARTIARGKLRDKRVSAI